MSVAGGKDGKIRFACLCTWYTAGNHWERTGTDSQIAVL